MSRSILFIPGTVLLLFYPSLSLSVALGRLRANRLFFCGWPFCLPGGGFFALGAFCRPRAPAAAGGSRGSKKILRPDWGLNPRSMEQEILPVYHPHPIGLSDELFYCFADYLSYESIVLRPKDKASKGLIIFPHGKKHLPIDLIRVYSYTRCTGGFHLRI